MKNEKKDYTFEDLIGIIDMLRSEGGCPWDRKQTHQSIKANLLEESYEAIEALDSGDKEKFADELGDVLLQVVFHSAIGKSEGTFSIQDVLNHICSKMISRHTHIFGTDTAETTTEVLDTWEKNKRAEKGISSHTESLNDVCHYLPALIRAQKVQAKAAKAGFDWDNVSGAFDKVKEETAELEEAVAAGNPADIEEEFGDLLFAAVNVARFIDVKSELALTAATEKFIRRFGKMEAEAAKNGRTLDEMTLEEMDQLWDSIKHH